MGLLIRLPFYIVSIIIWTFVGGFISFVNLLTLPISGIIASLIPSYRHKVKEIARLSMLREGYSKINNFLRYGF